MNTVIMMNYIKILERTNVSDICISFVKGCFVVYKHSVVQLKTLFPHLLIYIFTQVSIQNHCGILHEKISTIPIGIIITFVL